MNKLIIPLLFAGCFFFNPILKGQDNALTQEFKTSTVKRIDELLNERYVFPDVAKQSGDHLKQKLASGSFDQATTLESFATALTTELQSVNRDKHMRVRAARQGQQQNAKPDWVSGLMEQLQENRAGKAGFVAAKKLDGNIGYVDFRYFAGLAEGAPVADTYMKLLAGSDAIIIDLRKNGGGNPAMVQYLCSYFFDKPVHLNSLYWREGNRTQDFWSLEKVNGQKMPDVPLFILTSKRTFSGAEEFSYNMQTRNRATLVGETTGGGANPGGGVPINEKLTIFIPTGKAINPVTKTNWEGVGVVPTVQTTAEEAYDKAVALATTAAAAYREKNQSLVKSLLGEINTDLNNISANGWNAERQAKLTAGLRKAHKEGVLSEDDINMLGYFHLQQIKETALAEAIFRSNTELFPVSPNVYDSYGEALLANGKSKESVASYQKAVDLASKAGSQQLDQIKQGLAKAEKAAGKP